MKNKKLIAVLVGVLIILLILVGIFFLKQFAPKESIDNTVKKALTVSKYSTDITYNCKNSRGEFVEKGTLEYSKEDGAKINLGYVEQTFTDDKIKIHYFDDEEKGIKDKTYTVDRSYDEFYRYFLINEIPKYLTEDSTTYTLDENDENIIQVEFLTNSKNVNFHKALLKVDKNNKVVKSLSIYDDKGKERVEVNYSNFKKLK